MKRDTQQWLPVNLMPQASHNYGYENFVDSVKLPPINPKIIDAVKQDAMVAQFAAGNLNVIEAGLTLTPTVEITPTNTLLPSLFINAGGPYQGDEGSIITLMIDQTSLIGWVPGAISYNWDLDNDGYYDDRKGIVAAVQYFDEGNYTVGVQAKDIAGRVATDTATIIVDNVAPEVKIEKVDNIYEADQAIFLATVRDPGHDILLYEWNFGDGSLSVSDTLTPRHTYLDDGDYTVSLRVRDNDDGIGEDVVLVQVENIDPLVDAGPDHIINEGTRVDFNGSATDPANDQDTLTYAWDLNFNGTFTPDVWGSTVSVFYGDGPAQVAVALRVTDEDGGRGIDIANVTVNNLNPTLTGVNNSSPAGEGSSVTLQATATDVPSDTLTYAFDWDNNGSFDATNNTGVISHIWYNQGNYPVRIRAADDDGGQILTTTVVSISNIAPTAVAAGPTGPRYEGASINFSAAGSSDPGIYDVLTYTWNFGDGNTASGLNVTHVYADNDVYSATLTVADDSNASDTASLPVTILNANPVADAGPNRIVNEGVQVTFNGITSDPGLDDVLTSAWDFVFDGTTFDVQATGLSVQTVYLDGPATIDVGFRVRDDDYPMPPSGGDIGEHLDTFQVTVRNVPPVVNAQGPYVGDETNPVTLSGLATDVVLDPLVFEWDLDNDNIFETPGQTVINTWNTAGVYTVTLQAIDDDGGIGQQTTRVTIRNANPIAEANGPYTTTVNLPVTLSSAGSTDPTGDPLTYYWNFNDGTPVISTTNTTVSHTFADDGPHTVTLQAIDNRGGVGTDTALVTVKNLTPTAVAAAIPTVALEGTPIIFDGSASTDPGTLDVLTYRWNFGDGSPLGNGITTTHAYPDNNLYAVTLTVIDDGGLSDTDTINVTTLNANPIAAAGPDQTVTEGAVVSFDAGTSTDPGIDDTLTFGWDFDYNGVNFTQDAVGVSVQTIYTNGPFTHTVAMRARDDDYPYPTAGGGQVGQQIDTLRVFVQNVSPIADAQGPYNGIETVPITLSATATDAGADTLTFKWDVDNDGSYDLTGQTVNYSWNTAGIYPITLRVTDGDGGTDIDTTSITINNAPPIADAGGPYVTTVNIPVTFNAAGSYDLTGDPLRFRWDFGDGSLPVITTALSVSHIYLNDNVYTAILAVDDYRGGNDTDTAQVTVNNLPPVASAVITPNFVFEGTTINFDGNNSTDPGIYDTLTYTWNFGDGSPTVNGTTATHIYLDNNLYSATLTVTDDGGATDTDTVSITILNAVPNAAATASATTVFEGTAINFDASGSTDVGLLDALTYQWDFGDSSPNSGGITATHTYTDNNVYTTTLTVTDKDGASDSDTIVLTVLNANPMAAITATPNPVSEGNTITLNVTSSNDPGADDTLNYAWDFDYDGLTFDVDGTGTNITTVYSNGPALHTVALRVRDDDYPSTTGEPGETITTLQVTVNNTPPTADAGGPYITTAGITVTLTGSGSDVLSDTLSFNWDLDDNGTFETPGSVVSYTTAITGVYTVTLQVQDSDGGATTDTTTIQVNIIFVLGPGLYWLLRRNKKRLWLRKETRASVSKAIQIDNLNT